MNRFRSICAIVAATLAPLGLVYPHFIFAALLLLVVRAGLNGIGVRRIAARLALVALLPVLLLMLEAVAADRGLFTYPVAKYLTPRLALFAADTTTGLVLLSLSAVGATVAELLCRVRSRLVIWTVLTAAMLAPFLLTPAPLSIYIRRAVMSGLLAVGYLYLHKTTATMRWFSGLALGLSLVALGTVRAVPTITIFGLLCGLAGVAIALYDNFTKQQPGNTPDQQTAAHQ